jgi:hypothetical protein
VFGVFERADSVRHGDQMVETYCAGHRVAETGIRLMSSSSPNDAYRDAM